MSKIKYHQYGVGNDYGADHMLTDNWNPELDYEKEYVKVYFRIRTPSFENMYGSFNSNEDRDKWNMEASNTIKSLGIIEDCRYDWEKSQGKGEYLYAHPQEISGVVLKNNVKKIAETINKMELSSVDWVDLYETYYLISDEEYEKYLDGKKDEIRKLLFKECSTTRTSKYYAAFDVARYIAGVVRLHRVGLNDGANYGSGQTINYILNVAQEMIKEGYLKGYIKNNTRYVRSLNKTEQRKLKLYME
jgi:hypothetical protein